MAKLSFNAELSSPQGDRMKVSLQLYEFVEDGLNIVYCPALDLSAYGESEDEAQKGFQETFRQYINYCTSKNTLKKDLQKHGWNVKSSRQKRMTSPSFDEMLSKNKTLVDILKNKEYKKINQSVEIPQFC